MMHRPILRLALSLLLVLSLSSCGDEADGGGTTPTDVVTGHDTPVGSGDTTPGLDTSDPGNDTVPGVDSSPGVDTVEPVDTTIIPDIVPGSGQLGDPCTAGGDCASTLCWSTTRGSGCTVACEGHAPCQEFGGICASFYDGQPACAPAPPSASADCTSHHDCVFPSVCMDEFGWCDLPECTWDGDCSEGFECHPVTRTCQATPCVSTVQCEHPLETCVDGKCTDPECLEDTDCATGELCHPVQHHCEAATTCATDEDCGWYNLLCVDGICRLNLCVDPCSTESDVCNPATGECGPACTAYGDCPQGYGCSNEAGMCYQNHEPYAVARIEVAPGTFSTTTFIDVGATAQLDATASFDPDGGTLTYEWRLDDVPANSSLTPGSVLPDTTARPEFHPPSAGLHAIGLWVQDETGAWSMADQIVVWAD